MPALHEVKKYPHRGLPQSTRRFVSSVLGEVLRHFFVVDRDFSHPFPATFFEILFNKAISHVPGQEWDGTHNQLVRLLQSLSFEVYDEQTKTIIHHKLNPIPTGRRRSKVFVGIRPMLNADIAWLSSGLVKQLPKDHNFMAADPFGDTVLAEVQEHLRLEMNTAHGSYKLRRFRADALKKQYVDAPRDANGNKEPANLFFARQNIFPYLRYFENKEKLLATHVRRDNPNMTYAVNTHFMDSNGRPIDIPEHLDTPLT